MWFQILNVNDWISPILVPFDLISFIVLKGLDGYEKMPSRNVELGNAAAGVPGCLGDIYEEFEKEDMSEMFRRAFLEQMEGGDDNNRQVDNKNY